MIVFGKDSMSTVNPLPMAPIICLLSVLSRSLVITTAFPVSHASYGKQLDFLAGLFQSEPDLVPATLNDDVFRFRRFQSKAQFDIAENISSIVFMRLNLTDSFKSSLISIIDCDSPVMLSVHRIPIKQNVENTDSSGADLSISTSFGFVALPSVHRGLVPGLHYMYNHLNVHIYYYENLSTHQIIAIATQRRILPPNRTDFAMSLSVSPIENLSEITFSIYSEWVPLLKRMDAIPQKYKALAKEGVLVAAITFAVTLPTILSAEALDLPNFKGPLLWNGVHVFISLIALAALYIEKSELVSRNLLSSFIIIDSTTSSIFSCVCCFFNRIQSAKSAAMFWIPTAFLALFVNSSISTIFLCFTTIVVQSALFYFFKRPINQQSEQKVRQISLAGSAFFALIVGALAEFSYVYYRECVKFCLRTFYQSISGIRIADSLPFLVNMIAFILICLGFLGTAVGIIWNSSDPAIIGGMIGPIIFLYFLYSCILEQKSQTSFRNYFEALYLSTVCVFAGYSYVWLFSSLLMNVYHILNLSFAQKPLKELQCQKVETITVSA